MLNTFCKYTILAATLPATAFAETVAPENPTEVTETAAAADAPREFDDVPFLTTFDTFTQDIWYISDFAIKKPTFMTAWDYDQVHHTDTGQLVLSLDPAPINTGKRFLGSEVQRKEYSHFGRYEVVMTAGEGNGVISAFFTYTGPYFEDPHDEIDFEFLGRDTNKVWLTRFTDGGKLPGSWIDLDFDSAEGMHHYAFEWSPDSIVWFIDGVEVFRTDATEEKPIPNTPGRIYLSIWGGGAEQREWSGVAPRNTSTKASYDCISYVPMGQTATQCSDLPEYAYE